MKPKEALGSRIRNFVLSVMSWIVVIVTLGGVLCGIVCGLLNPSTRMTISIPLVGFVAMAIWGMIYQKKWIERMRAERAGESICTFARSLPARNHDTKIVRVVYEANPLAGHVITVTDLIMFLEMQPSLKSAA